MLKANIAKLNVQSRHYKIKFANLKGQAMRFTKGMKGGSKIRSQITFATNIEELEKIMRDAYSISN